MIPLITLILLLGITTGWSIRATIRSRSERMAIAWFLVASFVATVGLIVVEAWS